MELSGPDSELKAEWKIFLKAHPTDLRSIEKIDFSDVLPVIHDLQGRKFSIDFLNDKRNYLKKKSSMKTELISKALGGGKKGRRILDLSAGLGVDAVFLSQLGYTVTALERNPVIYLALHTAWKNLPVENRSDVKFIFASAENFLQQTTESFDSGYFDPMFPGKKKSALPKQEMILFKELVGADDDSSQVIQKCLQSKKFSRLVVKRPIKAEPLFSKPQSSVPGKLIRFDIYGGLK